MLLKRRIEAFSKLGEIINSFLIDIQNIDNDYQKYHEKLTNVTTTVNLSNPWFTEQFVRFALKGISEILTVENIQNWLSSYQVTDNQIAKKRVVVVMAGNIPLVGFHDFLSVLITGNIFIGKLSSKDDKLMRAIADILIDIEPEYKNFIFFEEHLIKEFDAVIATGSNNSSRYFEYYFGKYPHIIRKNRNSIAVLTGNESETDMKSLADDIFVYFGLGCRNVSKLYIPQDYEIREIYKYVSNYNSIIYNHKYANNYEYHRTIYMMSKIPIFDNDFLILKNDPGLSSPISVLFYETYNSPEEILQIIEIQKDKIQCIVSNADFITQKVGFGCSQKPQLWDYADNVDVVEFLLNL